MNKISRSNYEEFIIDHLDGVLSPEREAELLLFLNENLDIKTEFEGIGEMILSPDEHRIMNREVEAVFECRNCLKKSVLDSSLVNKDNFEEFCIAYAEGDLNKKESEYLMNYLHDFPSLNVVFRQHVNLKLQADLSLTFTEKESLIQFTDQSTEPISTTNYQDYIIASQEGDLSQEREFELEAFLSNHKELREEARVFGLLKLQADKSIVFANKSALKRRRLGILFTNNWINVAVASVAIFLFFYFIIPTDKWSGDTERGQQIKKKNIIAKIELEQKTDRQNTGVKKEKAESIKTKKASVNRKYIVKKSSRSIQNTREHIHISKVNPMAIESVDYEQMAVNSTFDNRLLDFQFPNELLQRNNVVGEVENDNMELEKIYEVKGIAGKLLAKFSKRLLKAEKNKKANFKDHLIAVADYAVAGFNRMTEADISLPRQGSSPQDKPKGRD